MHFLEKTTISFSACNSKIKITLAISDAVQTRYSYYNTSISLRTKSSEQEKIHKFMIHAANSVRIAMDAGNFNASLHHCLHRIAYCKSNSLLILLESVETEIRFRNANGMFKKMDIDRHGPRLMPNNCQILDPPYFSLPTTFIIIFF